MKRTLFAMTTAALLAAGAASAELISEFEPNPAGTDPQTVSVELSGTPNASFSGFLSSIESDVTSGTGEIDRSTAVSGTYDANGLAVVEIGDLENPSFTFVFSSADGGGVGTDYDADNDGTLDVSLAAFGTIYDAIGIDDANGDPVFGVQFGGQDFASNNEWEIAFRDASTGDWYGVDTGFSEVYDIDGNLLNNGDFVGDPFTTSFGAINPTLIPEPSSLALLGLGGLLIARRRRG